MRFPGSFCFARGCVPFSDAMSIRYAHYIELTAEKYKWAGACLPGHARERAGQARPFYQNKKLWGERTHQHMTTHRSVHSVPNNSRNPSWPRWRRSVYTVFARFAPASYYPPPRRVLPFPSFPPALPFRDRGFCLRMYRVAACRGAAHPSSLCRV